MPSTTGRTTTGIDKILEIQAAQAERSRARAITDLWNKVHTLIRSIPGRDVAAHQVFCARLEQLPAAEREAAVLAEYGQVCLDRLQPLLYQLDSVGL